MRVLLTNDDGIRAEGLRAMYRALREAGHTVHVVAPMHEQSGVGHSLTFFDPLRAHKGSGAFPEPQQQELHLLRVVD